MAGGLIQDGTVDPFAGLGSLDDDEVEAGGGVMLDPPDPLDLLIAHTENSVIQKPKPLDFVRAKFQEMKKDNKRLKERVADLEQTLSIVQTAQEWSSGKGTTQEQRERMEKMREIKALLEQAKRAREEIQNFSGASRQSLYEQLRSCKAALKKEKEEKLEMKDRLLHAFDHARAIKDQLRQVSQQRQAENERWQDTIRDLKERHRRELRRLGEGAAMENEQVHEDLFTSQQNVWQVRGQTVGPALMEDDGEDGAEAGRPGQGVGDGTDNDF
jgi:chromosome segregation ATPase